MLREIAKYEARNRGDDEGFDDGAFVSADGASVDAFTPR
jgi:hypothetical protein|eukprot:COSAG01_NODE_17204_length_1170_cov_1.577031_1_plen_39_part_00